MTRRLGYARKSPGAPFSPRAALTRRLLCQALARPGWRAEPLEFVAEALLGADAPVGAEAALAALRRARARVGDLRLMLIGALAIPGWPERMLRTAALRLVGQPPEPHAGEIVALAKQVRT